MYHPQELSLVLDVEFLIAIVLPNLQTPDLLLGHYSRRDAAILSMDLNKHNAL